MDYSPPIPEQSGFLRKITLGYHLGATFFFAHEEGLLSFLLSPRTLDEVATGCRMNPDKLSLVLGILVSGDIVQFSEGRYQVRQELSSFLDKNSMVYSRWIDQEAADRHWWAQLHQHVCDKGLSYQRAPRYPPLSKDEVQRMGMQALLGRLQGIISILEEDPAFPESRRLLDLGGGHGLIGIACAQANPDLSVTIYDRPYVARIAWEHACNCGVMDRVICVGGDYTCGRIGGGYDFILQICPSDHDPDTDSMMVQVIRSALAPGGRFVRCGFFLDNDITGPLITTSFALSAQMRGDSRHRTLKEIYGFMEIAGMEIIKTVDLSPWCELPMYMIIGMAPV